MTSTVMMLWVGDDRHGSDVVGLGMIDTVMMVMDGNDIHSNDVVGWG